MEILVDLIKIIAPSLIVFFTAYKVLKTYLENDQKKILLELKQKQKQQSLKVRLQAYERMALFLERIQPNSLISRVKQPGMNSRNLHLAVLANIRSEYDHNVSQQIYIGIETWELIKVAKENTINMINISAQKSEPQSDALDFQKNLIAEIGQIPAHELPTQKALFALKSEVQKMY